jgi:hypothetical protein
MLTEMLGKGGQVCQHAREGHIRCPLIIRPTSEDVITGQVFQVLRALNPRWWLPDVLNQAMGTDRFRQQVYRNLEINLWRNRPAYPRELLPWDEGSTQVDVTITWENPPTTIFVEVKYGSDLSPKTSADNGKHGFPSDQLVRNARVGLLECGWFELGGMFAKTPRDFSLVVLGPAVGHPLVAAYRHAATLRAAIPHSGRLKGLPKSPFIGELSYRDFVQRLKRNRRWFSRPERSMLDHLTDYLTFKASRLPSAEVLRQANLLNLDAVN